MKILNWSNSKIDENGNFSCVLRGPCLLSFEDIQTQATNTYYNLPSLMCVRLAWVEDVSAHFVVFIILQ